uniref:28S ribosomal protein S34, mitochondrial n=1 Tax=Vitis vinifera TaxID=29760 RepID=F6GUV8_VITVI
MATAALANRASTDRTWNLLRQSFRFFRSFSAAPSASSSSVASSPNPTASKKPKRRKKKNLFEVAQFLPNWGLGYHMAKTHWTGVSYEITKINLYKDGRHGKAWGLVHKDVRETLLSWHGSFVGKKRKKVCWLQMLPRR